MKKYNERELDQLIRTEKPSFFSIFPILFFFIYSFLKKIIDVKFSNVAGVMIDEESSVEKKEIDSANIRMK